MSILKILRIENVGWTELIIIVIILSIICIAMWIKNVLGKRKKGGESDKEQ
jgi:hypothetical protein